MALRGGGASGDFGWGVLPVVMLTHSLRSVASITTGYSEATLRVGGAIGALGAIGGWGIRDGLLYNVWAGVMILIFFNRKNQSVFCLFYGIIVILHVTIS